MANKLSSCSFNDGTPCGLVPHFNNSESSKPGNAAASNSQETSALAAKTFGGFTASAASTEYDTKGFSAFNVSISQDNSFFAFDFFTKSKSLESLAKDGHSLVSMARAADNASKFSDANLKKMDFLEFLKLIHNFPHSESLLKRLLVTLQDGKYYDTPNVFGKIFEQKIQINLVSSIIFNPMLCSKPILTLRLEIARMFYKIFVEKIEDKDHLKTNLTMQYIQFEMTMGDKEYANSFLICWLEKLEKEASTSPHVLINVLKAFLYGGIVENVLSTLNVMLSSPAKKYNLDLCQAIKACYKANQPELIENILEHCKLLPEFEGHESILKILHLCFLRKFQLAMTIDPQISCPTQKFQFLLIQKLIAEKLNDSKAKADIRKKLCQALPKIKSAEKILYINDLCSYEIASGDLEFAIPFANAILKKCFSSKVRKTLWRSYAMNILAAMGIGNYCYALEIAEKGVTQFPKNARVIELFLLNKYCTVEQDSEFMIAIQNNLQNLPKTGNFWLMAAQLCMNPCSSHFNLMLAEIYIVKAIQNTPQYGDIFIEWLKLLEIKKQLGIPHEDQSSLQSDIDQIASVILASEYNLFGIQWTHASLQCSEYAGIQEILTCVQQTIKKNISLHVGIYRAAHKSQRYSSIDPTNSDELYQTFFAALGNPFKLVHQIITKPNTTVVQQMRIASFFAMSG